LALSTPMVRIMNIFPIFNSFCLNLPFKSRHWQYFKFSSYFMLIWYIICVCCSLLYICINIFCNVSFCLHLSL
jgi:hypothetical protein